MRRLAANTLLAYLRQGVQILVFFWLTPTMLSSLGTAGFGLWNLVASLVGLVALLEGGLGVTTLRAGARRGALSGAAREHAEAELSTLWWAHLGLALAGCLATAGLAASVVRMDLEPGQQATAQELVWLLGARFVFLLLPLSFFRNLLSATHMARVSAVQAAGLVLYGLGAAWLLQHGLGLRALAWWNLGAALGEHLVYLAWLGPLRPRLHPRAFRADLLRPLLTFSLCSFAGTVAAQVLLRSDPIILKLFLPTSAVALYAVAMKVAENAHLLTKQVVNVLTPLAAGLHAAGDRQRTRALLLDGTRLALAPALLMALALGPCSRELLTAWLGPELAPAAGVLSLLVLATTLAIPQLLATTVLAMGGREAFTARAALLSCGLNLALSLLLTPTLGLLGPALGTFLTTLVVDLGVVLPEALRHVEVSAREYLSRALLPTLFPTLAGLAVTEGLRAQWAPATLPEVAGVCLPGLLLAGCLLTITCIPAPLRARLIQKERATR